MVCSGFKPGAAGWRVKTDPLGAMINKVASHWDRLMMTLKTIESSIDGRFYLIKELIRARFVILKFFSSYFLGVLIGVPCCKQPMWPVKSRQIKIFDTCTNIA